ncbi:MAG TPA: HIT family protein [Candidatus Binatia bacterium]|nr:HIT family protein [Candidatus Binatia bacterium]
MQQAKPKGCPFCDPAQAYRQLAETPLVKAIYPKDPACAYHILLVPKAHRRTLDELSSQEVSQVFQLLKRIVKTCSKALGIEFIGYQILSNNGGPAVNQRVEHCHVHLFIRTTSDKHDPIKSNHRGNAPSLTEEEVVNMKRLQSWLK